MTHRILIVALLVMTLAAPARAEEEPPPAWRLQRDLSFVTSDGVRLVADLYTPLTAGPYPTVLTRTPYDKEGISFLGEFLSERGYAVVIQDVRGKYGSEGQFVPFVHERADGLETLNWVSRQPWCNGRIGMWGSSYLGFTGLCLTDLEHPALEAVFSISGWVHGSGMAFPGGALHLMLSLPWLLTQETEEQRALDDYDIEELFEYLPLRDALSSIGIESELWEDEDTLKTAAADFDFGKVTVPIYHLTGWFDFVGSSTLEVYRRVLEEGNAPQKLTIGPWLHDQYYTDIPDVGEMDMGPGSILDVDGVCEQSLRWFDYWLRDIDNGVMSEPPVRVFLMQENEWRDFHAWPPATMEKQRWYLASGGDARSIEGSGALRPDPPITAHRDTFTFDPHDPVPTHGGANFHFFGSVSGMLDQEDIELRDDVLVYTSRPVSRPLRLLGDVRAHLCVSTEAVATDVTAKLVTVNGEGRALSLADGILRLGGGHEETEPLLPGHPYEISIELGPIGVTIPAGHRLRLQISSSNFPKYDRNPNTGESAFEATRLVPARQTILTSPERPSYLELPVLQNEERSASR